MVSVRQSLSASYPAIRDAVSIIRREIAEYARSAGITGDRLDAVRLAVSEAATNVVVHAYRGRGGQVHVTAKTAGGELWVLIADDGCGPHAPPQTPGLGWGLALITESCEEFTLLERAEGGTEARMCFPIADKRLRALTLADQ